MKRIEIIRKALSTFYRHLTDLTAGWAGHTIGSAWSHCLGFNIEVEQSKKKLMLIKKSDEIMFTSTQRRQRVCPQGRNFGLRLSLSYDSRQTQHVDKSFVTSANAVAILNLNLFQELL